MTTEVIRQQQETSNTLLPAITGWMFRKKWMKQVFKFVLVGILNTLLDAAIYLVLTRWLGLGSRQALAKAISYGAGVINSYAWNRTWTFKSEASVFVTLAPFVLTGLVGAAISSAVMRLGLELLLLPEAAAFILATAATFAWNFMINKFVVFRK